MLNKSELKTKVEKYPLPDSIDGVCSLLREILTPGSVQRVEIDVDKCTGDEECVNVCPTGVFEMQDDKAVVVNEDECLGCESCVEVCPSAAITITET